MGGLAGSVQFSTFKSASPFYTRVMTLTMIGIALASAVMMSLFKYFADSNSRDLGTMSEKWLAEYKNSHP